MDTAAGIVPDGNAVVYCEGSFSTTYGKTAHGLVRRTRRYRILSVIDSECAGRDAGELLDGRRSGIPLVGNLQEAVQAAREAGNPATHFVIGLAPDGGRLDDRTRQAVLEAVAAGFNVDSGLHDFLGEDSEIAGLAMECGVVLRDIRKTPSRKQLHAFTGRIQEVTSLKVALLGTDSAIGKRTTAWLLVEALESAGYTAELIGTGQTAWMQGARYGIILDSLINDFVAGEIEHALWSAWQEQRSDVLVIEGQGSLLNPAYPGGFEILAAGRPQAIVLQHAPARLEYDGFPGYALHPLEKQIEALELISGRPVVAITLNHENLSRDELPEVCRTIQTDTGLPVCDPIFDGLEVVVEALKPYLKR
ncbi:MAG: DUF1611 domain-containing protein [Spirochaetaceae bacterium]|nr:MAG: DUF1611 domain-containing protein [Spirochaetaceae bacterium]